MGLSHWERVIILLTGVSSGKTRRCPRDRELSFSHFEKDRRQSLLLGGWLKLGHADAAGDKAAGWHL